MEIILRLSILLSFLCFGFVNGQSYNVLNYGAEGDGQTDDSNAFMKTWNAACGGEGDINIVSVPAGKTFLLQPIVLQGPCKANSIKVQLDGTIVAPSTKDEWSNPKSQTWISFTEVLNLSIDGSGTINGHGSSFWKAGSSERPTALHINKCDNLKVNGITSIDSPKTHISMEACTNAAISNINLVAPENSPNTDGIHISNSKSVKIFDSTIQTGDDCIAINTGTNNINITKINCGPGHGISVGSLGNGGIEAEVSDIQVAHCTFNQTMNGARIKTWQGGQGYARNISFEDITLINAKNPIIIDQHYTNDGQDATGGSAVAISGVKFIGFSGTTASEEAIVLNCSEVTHCKDVVMDGINITTASGGKPNVQCQNVDGESSDSDLMRDCFKK